MTLPLSFVAEYNYCPRSAFYLLTDAPKLRDENIFIQSGREAHQKVDDGYKASKSMKRVETSVRVFLEKLQISGKTDILEFYPNEEIVPVELKRGSSRINETHHAQLALMALCLKEMFPQKIITRGAIFFTQNRRREEVLFSSELLQKAYNLASEVYNKVQNGMNPKNFPTKKDQRCNGCCFYNLCYI